MPRPTGACVLTFCIFASLPAGCARHYRADGLVLRLERERSTVWLSHRDIQGYMPAMVMPFQVRKTSELDGLAPGSQVRFELVVARGGSYARRIRLRAAAAGNAPAARPPEKIGVGAPVPDFALRDQLGRSARLSDFRGRVVALDFIYTRCPLPDFCPRLSANFARLQKRFGANLTLLSVSLDPQYDTPEVLNRYAKIWGADPERWRFLTGDAAEVRRVAAWFGVVYWPDEGVLTHSSETAVISPEGRLAALVDGPNYAVSQVGDLIAWELEGHP